MGWERTPENLSMGVSHYRDGGVRNEQGCEVVFFFKAAVETRSIPNRDLGLPRCLGSKESACQCKRSGFHP